MHENVMTSLSLFLKTKKNFAVPGPLHVVSPAILVCGWCKLSSDLDPYSLVQIRLQLFKWGHFHIFSLSYNLTSDDLWPWNMTSDRINIWRFPYYINKPSLVKSDFNFSNKAIFTFLAYLTTWPQMTFDLGIWSLTAWTYEGSHIISIKEVWFQLDFNFSNKAICTFLAYLTTWP